MSTDLLGIDIGSTNIKLCRLIDGLIAYQAIMAHEGDVPGTITKLLEDLVSARPLTDDLKALVTGTEGSCQGKPD